MKANHNSLADALQAFIDSGAKWMIPMHYGTFELSDEPASAPLRTLLAEAEEKGLRERVRSLAINESVLFDKNEGR